MLRYVLKRLLLFFPIIIAVIFFVFFMRHLLPGDPVKQMLFGSIPAPGQEEELRRQLGLDKPLHVQFGLYLIDFFRGDLGESFRTRRSVSQEIGERIWPTLELTFTGMGIAILVGFFLGIVAALKPDSWVDTASMTFANIAVGMPAFWLGILLIFLFSLTLGWFPITGQGGIKRLILPAITLGIGYSAIIARLVRTNLIEVLGMEYILTARAKGLREKVVLIRHAIKNALIPSVTIIGLQFGNMLGGAVVVEVLFARKGLGRLLVTGILNRDFPVAQGTILVLALGYLVSNLIVDILYSYLDPRIRYQ
jgi:peptide/nickel transport system permease protein